MYRSVVENKLIVPDIEDIMQDYVSIQLDIDSTKIKAACLVAQKDISKVIKKHNFNKCYRDNADFDEELFELVVPTLCYFTYYRALRIFQGTLTDGGFATEQEAQTLSSAKSAANEVQSIGEMFLNDVVDYLTGETSDEDEKEVEQVRTKKVRVFGGSSSASPYS
ncbi:hypothetical protein [Tenacibaculum phage Larrie]|nr:hypothetical protein [Tenacibaculum phage Larrie]